LYVDSTLFIVINSANLATESVRIH